MNKMKIFGTSENLVKSVVLRAGDLTAILEDGALRQIRYGGVEVLRGIAFLARDAQWGTYKPHITALEIDHLGRTFCVSFEADISDDSQSLTMAAKIIGQPDGRLEFSAKATANTMFLTNRTGFVILHPINSAACQSGSIGHPDGTSEAFTFPEMISPGQPAMKLAWIAHAAAPGLTAKVAMEGSAFEMEDHRNWMDASFKTYSGSLLEPWPYQFEQGSVLSQKVTLTLQGKPAAQGLRRTAAITISLSGHGPNLPQMGTSLSAGDLDKGPKARDLLDKAKPAQIAFRVDLRTQGWFADISRLKAVLPDRERVLKLEVILTAQKTAQEEMARLADHLSAAGISPVWVVPSHPHDMASFQPGAPRPFGPTYEAMAHAARAAFPTSQIGGGMLAFFTELNRKPPPIGVFDFITHAVCPSIHADDDRTVMENLEALPSIFRSVRSMIGSADYHLGPSGISSRDNPYGERPSRNLHNRRMCLTERDPRERGLFGAVWMLGLINACAQHGLGSLCVGPTLGHFMHDEAWGEGKVTPAFHLLASLGRLGGARTLISTSNRSGIVALAVQSGRGQTLWVANLTAKPLMTRIAGGVVQSEGLIAHRLDEESFDAIGSSDYLASAGTVVASRSDISLAPYGLVRLVNLVD